MTGWRRRFGFVAVLSLALCLPGGFAQAATAPVGEVSAAVGSLEIVRNGGPIPAGIEAGTTLLPEDLLVTAGLPTELLLFDRGRLTLSPETVVHLRREPAAEAAEESTVSVRPAPITVEILSGSARFAAFSESVTTMHSGALTASIRDGEASLFAAPGDNRLLVAHRGRQTVRGATGVTRFAEAGRPVVFDGTVRNVAVVPELWLEGAASQFRQASPAEVAGRMDAYVTMGREFNDAYEAVLEYRTILSDWFRRADRRLDTGAQETLAENEGLRETMGALFTVGERMEERFFQLRMDEPYLSRRYREYLADEEAYLLSRLHQLRRLRLILAPLTPS